MLSNQGCGKREKEGRGKREKRSRWRRDGGEEGRGKGWGPGLERARKEREGQEGEWKLVGTDARKQGGVGDG